MSGLELVASIAGVAAAAIRVSVSMNDLAEELGSAGRDVRYISNDMAGFSQVLRLVQSSLEESIKSTGSNVIQSVFETLPQLVEQCSMVYDEANGLMVALKPDEDASLSFFKRMKFVFYKGRITILRSLLDSSKSTLNLLLVTLNIEMAKSKRPDKALMEQLQNERRAFIRVVYSQNKALDEATKEIEKAKKEAVKFKTKRDKEKEKEKEENRASDETSDEYVANQPERQSTPYSYRPPPPYTLHSAPSVSQLVYQPPSLDRINSVRKSSNAVRSLAISLEPPSPGNCGMPTPPSSPPDGKLYESFFPSTTDVPHPQPPPPATGPWESARASETPPQQSGKRVFSDPGPGQPRSSPTEHLGPGNIPRERSRSPYGFSRVPQDQAPKVERKRPFFSDSPQSSNTANSTHQPS
ncbi:hypothetical protein GQ44DRAFT_254461 [Phaeosphaeriaceae sp. PMI808]|nr:hypothetical protein GQ44DRAFT_254461 [Phaeosphaeriaceae sp. PMI808]